MSNETLIKVINHRDNEVMGITIPKLIIQLNRNTGNDNYLSEQWVDVRRFLKFNENRSNRFDALYGYLDQKYGIHDERRAEIEVNEPGSILSYREKFRDQGTDRLPESPMGVKMR